MTFEAQTLTEIGYEQDPPFVQLFIVPGGIIALMIPFYLRTALRSPQHVRSGRLLWAKLGVGLVLAAIQSSCLALWHNASLFGSYYSLAASACSLLASVGILFIL